MNGPSPLPAQHRPWPLARVVLVPAIVGIAVLFARPGVSAYWLCLILTAPLFLHHIGSKAQRLFRLAPAEPRFSLLGHAVPYALLDFIESLFPPVAITLALGILVWPAFMHNGLGIALSLVLALGCAPILLVRSMSRHSALDHRE